ncbi:MAG: O-antigen ligase family protein [Betaproteobacteria bacterium]
MPAVSAARSTETISTSFLIRFATVAAGIAILVSPFRASAGLRGAMLLLAGLAILSAYVRAGQFRQLMLPYKVLVIATGAWLLAASAWSFVGPSPLESLSVVKRDILTPMLAFMVFYALTRTRADMLRWISILTVGLFVLTVMVMHEPFDPLATLQESDYLTVGLLSTWIVTLAPVLALSLFADRKWRRRGLFLAVVGLCCLLISAWLSGNRTVWACFAAMVVMATFFGSQGRAITGARWRSTAIVLVLLTVLVSFMFAAMQFRARTQAPAGTGPLTFLLSDNRAPILSVAVDMISERPLLGRGYDNPNIGDLFAARFDTPWLRNYVHQPHNVVLNHALQMGVTGALVILFLFVALAWTFMRRLPLGGLARLAGLCGIALVTGVFLRNMTDDFFNRHTVQFFGAAAGMLLGLATHRPPLNLRKSPRK